MFTRWSTALICLGAAATAASQWNGEYMMRLRAHHVKETVFVSAGNRRLAGFFDGLLPDPHWNAKNAAQAVRKARRCGGSPGLAARLVSIASSKSHTPTARATPLRAVATSMTKTHRNRVEPTTSAHPTAPPTAAAKTATTARGMTDRWAAQERIRVASGLAMSSHAMTPRIAPAAAAAPPGDRSCGNCGGCCQNLAPCVNNADCCSGTCNEGNQECGSTELLRRSGK